MRLGTWIRSRSLTAVVVALIAAGGLLWWRRTHEPTGSAAAPVQDHAFERAVDALLEEVNPNLASNQHFPGFVKERLRWLNREHSSARLDVRAFDDAADASLPPDVVMASMRDGARAAIVISKRRLVANLLRTGDLSPPFSLRQRNDFAISLTHEIVHLQNPDADRLSADDHAREEWRVWREVTVRAVRPLRQLGSPVDPSFVEVDDAFLACRDAPPCPRIGQLVLLRTDDMLSRGHTP